MIRALFRTLLLLLLLPAVACTGREDPASPAIVPLAEPVPVESPTAAAMTALLERANRTLREAGSPFGVASAEWLMAGVPTSHRVLAFDTGNRKLPLQFVPGDPRRIGGGSGTSIAYLVDGSDVATRSGLTAQAVEAAVDRAMASWASLRCGPPLEKIEDDGTDPDFLDGIFGFGEVGEPRAQIVHAGWLRGILPADILAITFTVGFRDEQGLYTDIDGDGRWDCAFRETYYNDDWTWGIDADLPALDVESVALHEAGHGLSQGHFGQQSLVLRTGEIRNSPIAVMNAGYTGRRQELTGTDRAGHCAIWGSWRP